MYKKLLILAAIMLSAVITFAQPSQYTPMTAQGYQFKRILCDSTLHLPSFCGVPNLRNSTAKNGALAIDTCNNKLYQWTRLNGWSIVGGTTIDTTSLSNRINTKIDSLKRSTDSIFARVNGVWKFQYKDSIGGTTIDTTSLSNRINTKIDSLKRSTDSVFARVNGVWKFQYKDSTGGGTTPSLQAVTDVGASTTNMITASTHYATTEYNKIDVGNQVYYPFYATDNSGVFPIESYIRMGNYGGLEPEFYNGKSIGNYNRLTPTYLEFGNGGTAVYLKIPTINLGNDDHYLPVSDNTTDTLATTAEVATKLNINDTANMLTKYLRKVDTASLSNRIDLKLNINDTANMLTKYLRKVDTASLSNRIDLKLNISDTANKWVTSVTKLNDSTIRVVKNTTTTDITLTPAATVTAATRLVTTVYNNSGSTITKGSVVYINGRHSSNLPTIALAQANTEGNSYSTFALIQDDITNGNSGIAIQAGNITNLNLPTSSYTDGEVVYLSPTVAGGITTNKNSVLAPNHIVKIGTITRAHPTAGGIEIKIENGWQLDELSDVQIPVVPNDSTLLQFSRVDSLWHSVSVNNAIGTKYIKPSDTATMLTPYLRKVDTTGKFVNNITRTAGKDSIIFFIGGTRYAIKDSVGGGGGSAAGSTGNIQFNSSGAFAGSNDLFWDNTNARLGIGTASPTNDFTLSKSVNGNTDILNFNSSTGTSALSRFIVRNNTNNEGQLFASGSNWSGYGSMTGNAVGFYSSLLNGIQIAADGNFTQTRIQFMTGTTPSTKMVIQNNGNVQIGTTTDAGYKLDVNGTTRLNGTTLINTASNPNSVTFRVQGNGEFSGGISASSSTIVAGNQIRIGSQSISAGTYRTTNAGSSVTPKLWLQNDATSTSGKLFASWDETNQLSFNAFNSGSIGIARASIGITNLANTAGSESGDMIFSTQSGGTAMTEKMRLTSGGGLTLTATNTAAGTTGNQTINKPSGTVNIAAAGTTITVTNSLVTTSSIVFATIRTNDATATIKNVVPSAGSFVINLNAATTAETSIGFFVIN